MYTRVGSGIANLFFLAKRKESEKKKNQILTNQVESPKYSFLLLLFCFIKRIRSQNTHINTKTKMLHLFTYSFPYFSTTFSSSIFSLFSFQCRKIVILLCSFFSLPLEFMHFFLYWIMMDLFLSLYINY